MNSKKFLALTLGAMMVCSALQADTGIQAQKKINYGKLWGIAEVTVMPIVSVIASVAGAAKIEKLMHHSCTSSQGMVGLLFGLPVGCVLALGFFVDGVRNIMKEKEDDNSTLKDVSQSQKVQPQQGDKLSAETGKN